MMEYADARPIARMFAAIGEPTRIRIASFLLAGPLHVGRIAELLGLPMVNVSHHLGVMRQAGIIEDEKKGRHVIYRYRDEVLKPGDEDGSVAILQFGPFRLLVGEMPDLSVKPKAKSKAPK